MVAKSWPTSCDKAALARSICHGSVARRCGWRFSIQRAYGRKARHTSKWRWNGHDLLQFFSEQRTANDSLWERAREIVEQVIEIPAEVISGDQGTIGFG